MPDEPDHNILPGFDGHYGLRLTRVDGDEVHATVPVRPEVLQPFGLVHGGVYAAMAEAMASVATWRGTGEDKFVAGMSNYTTFLRPITEGTVHAVGKPLHRGKSTWIWDVTITDDAERTCATVRVTIAVRQPR